MTLEPYFPSWGQSLAARVSFPRPILTFLHEAMDDWSDATFRLHVVLRADCKRFPVMSCISNATRFAFVEYESRRDADDAYYEMHNKRLGRDELLKIEVCPCFLGQEHTLIAQQWARTPPSASWRFDSGRDRDRRRSPRRRSLSPPRRSRGDYSPRKDDRRDRDYDRRDRDRSRSPDGDREMKDVRDRRDDDDRENGTNGEDRKGETF